MYLLRSARKTDLDHLFELASQVTFINLPADKDNIEKKVALSERSFQSPDKILHKNYYFFVLEDLNTQSVVGASMIHAQHGTEEEPHFYLKVGQEKKYSTTINTGFIHGTLKLGIETNGPTEIGGLILDPTLRGNKLKLGKQLSFVRFLYMGMHPKRFRPTIHSELMPPLDKDGNSPLWEAIGRRFMNMDYHEADLLSRSNKEFILSLYPSDTIYQTLLPTTARNAIGKVGEDTAPVEKMLRSIGFEYIDQVDPFDGGPHFRAPLKKITPIRDMVKQKIELSSKSYKNSQKMLVAIAPGKDYFRALLLDVTLQKDKIVLPASKEINQLLDGVGETYAIPF